MGTIVINNPGALTTNGGQPINLTKAIGMPNFVGSDKLLSSSTNIITGNSGLFTSYVKKEAEAPFTAVRLWIGEKSTTTASSANWIAVVGVSDNMFGDTVSDMYSPMQSGVTYNSLSTGGIGFIPVTWDNGASSKSIILPYGQNVDTFMVSDWTPLASIPRGDIVGANPVVVLRLAQNAAGAAYSQSNYSPDAVTGYQAAKGLGFAWYRDIYGVGMKGVDGVTNLATLPPNTGNGSMAYCWLEFMYIAPTRHVVIIGDSTEQCAYSTYVVDNWSKRAILSLSTQSAPITHSTFAASGFSPSQYIPELQKCIAQGLKVTDLIMPGWSQNGFVQDYFGAQALIAQQTEFLYLMKSLGIRVFLTTSYVADGYSGTTELARQQCITWIRNMCNAGLAILVDTDVLITNYTVSPPLIYTAYDSGDHIHANPAGQALLQQALTNAWLQSN